MKNFDFWIDHGERESRIMTWIVVAFFFLIVGIAFGYAWAINAYGIQL